MTSRRRALPVRATTLLRLLRWLGPWTPDTRVPDGVSREPWLLRDGPMCGHRAFVVGVERTFQRPARLEAYLYRPVGRAPVGAYAIAPGLHFLGPDDPRLDRFCRVLARAGFLVAAPFLPGYVDLLAAANAADDFERVVRGLAGKLPRGERPALFSISFGSWPALEVAARLGDAVDGVVTFGGYCDFRAAVRFAVDGVMRTPEGDVQLARDPLNAPALFLNLLPALVEGEDTRELEQAFRLLCYRTWGKMELKAPGRLDVHVRDVAELVPSQQRELFLVACGALPGAPQLAERALATLAERFRYLDPAPALARIRCPVVVCHGRDDDVIPYGEALKLHARLAPVTATRLHVTGLFAHTGAGTPSPKDAAREAATLLGLATDIAHGGALRRRFGG